MKLGFKTSKVNEDPKQIQESPNRAPIDMEGQPIRMPLLSGSTSSQSGTLNLHSVGHPVNPKTITVCNLETPQIEKPREKGFLKSRSNSRTEDSKEASGEKPSQ